MATVRLGYVDRHYTGHPGGSAYGKWMKIPAYFSSTTTVFDLNGGASGYLRLKMSNTGILTAEAVLGGHTYSVVLSVPVPLGQWNWVAVSTGYLFPSSAAVQVNLYGPGGVSITTNNQLIDFGGVNTSIQVALGEGVTLSSSYAHWPNDGVSLCSKMNYLGSAGALNSSQSDLSILGPQTTDLSSQFSVICNARQSVGGATQLNDSSGNSNNLLAGPQGLVIVSDGPYAT